MKDTIDWHVERIAHGRKRFDGQVFVACFYWKYDELLIESAEYSLTELERVIREMKSGEPNYRKFLDAREHLQKALC